MKRKISLFLSFLLLLNIFIPTVHAIDFNIDDFGNPKTNVKYKDVSGNDWFYKEVIKVSEIDIMAGSAGNFYPTNPLLVSEALTIASRIHSKIGNKEIKDVTNAQVHWADPYIKYALSNGLKLQKKVSYDDIITRGEFVRYLLWATGIKLKEETQLNDTYFMVEKEPTELEQDLFKTGIVIGDSGGLRLGGMITRAEVATIILRFLYEDTRVLSESYIDQKILNNIPETLILTEYSKGTINNGLEYTTVTNSKKLIPNTIMPMLSSLMLRNDFIKTGTDINGLVHYQKGDIEYLIGMPLGASNILNIKKQVIQKQNKNQELYEVEVPGSKVDMIETDVDLIRNYHLKDQTFTFSHALVNTDHSTRTKMLNWYSGADERGMYPTFAKAGNRGVSSYYYGFIPVKEFLKQVKDITSVYENGTLILKNTINNKELYIYLLDSDIYQSATRQPKETDFIRGSYYNGKVYADFGELYQFAKRLTNEQYDLNNMGKTYIYGKDTENPALITVNTDYEATDVDKNANKYLANISEELNLISSAKAEHGFWLSPTLIDKRDNTILNIKSQNKDINTNREVYALITNTKQYIPSVWWAFKTKPELINLTYAVLDSQKDCLWCLKQLAIRETEKYVNDYDKAKALYNYITTHYDKNRQSNIQNEQFGGNYIEQASNFQVMLQSVGIPSLVVKMHNHAFNIVYIGDKWVLIDATLGSDNGITDRKYFGINPETYFVENIKELGIIQSILSTNIPKPLEKIEFILD